MIIGTWSSSVGENINLLCVFTSHCSGQAGEPAYTLQSLPISSFTFLTLLVFPHLTYMMALHEQGLRFSSFEQERAQERTELSLIGLSRPAFQEEAET